ncbi:MAG: 3-isopropylmalate dehydratase small subunit [Peptococcaceae bacterium]|nr:3-isopropylmalate dehydratase small subunit [Candidatus Syntrophopropionicum ammoniitolerans]
MEIRGKSWRFGSDVDTDAIIPARYLNTSDPAELAAHCMEGAVPSFPSGFKTGDIFVAGKNFGCGSSREHAPIAIKAAGVSCVIAGTFARIFYRNAFNIGLPIFESVEAAEDILEGDELAVAADTGVITNLTTGKTYASAPVPPFMQEIIAAGGLINYVANKFK